MMHKKQPIAPPSNKAPAAPTTMPFQPGQVLGSVPFSSIQGQSELTDEELALLARGGYRDGDPVPDLSDTAAGRKLRAQIDYVGYDATNTEGKTPIDPATPPLVIKPARNIKDLSPAEAAKAATAFKEMGELYSKMEGARAAAEAQKAQDSVPPELASIPGYLEAMATTRQQPSIDIIDDVGLTGGAPKLRLKQRIVPEPEVAVESAVEVVTSSQDYIPHCPRCLHNLNGPLCEPTQEDKIGYIALIMGDQKRFRKTVSLFGGRIIVTFRSLLTSEENLALVQIDEDTHNNKFANLILYTATLEDYRMLMSIESVQRKGKQTLEIAPIGDYEFDSDVNTTPLPEFKAWLDDELFSAFSLRNTVSKSHWEFAQILQYLESRAPDDPFFDGIG